VEETEATSPPTKSLTFMSRSSLEKEFSRIFVGYPRLPRELCEFAWDFMLQLASAFTILSFLHG